MNHSLRTLTFILFSAFGLVTLTVHAQLWQSLDWDLLLATQSALPRAADFPSSVLSLVGTAEVTMAAFLILVLLAPASQRIPLLITFGLATVIELAGKTLIEQPHTPRELMRYLFHVPIPSGTLPTSFSFPSGHVARTTFLVIVGTNWMAATRLPLSVKRILYALLCVLEIGMLISRVYLAEHWFADVLGGALLGSAFALVALQWQFDPVAWVRTHFNHLG